MKNFFKNIRNYFLGRTTKLNIYKQTNTIDFMKKIIKKYGSSHVIIFDHEDRDVYELEEGDIIELTMIKVGKKKK